MIYVTRMYGLVLALSSATTAATTGFPFVHMGELKLGPLPLQSFGIIVATGVLIGAWILRRSAEWHGLSDDLIRSLLGWVTISGFIGAHVLDVIMYEPGKIGGLSEWAIWPPQKWPGLLRIWDGISSYGGFVGGALGFAIFVWWKRLKPRLMADVTIVGLLPAFSIGRIGCTVVSDHIGAAVDPNAWYASFAMWYPRSFNTEVVRNLALHQPGTGPILAWNLGLIELLYLIPVNALILWLAFRPKQRMPAGFLIALAALLYAPVRFFLEFLRPTSTDPLHAGLTFAQWASLATFTAAGILAARLLKNGEPAAVVAPTSGAAQALLRQTSDQVDKERLMSTDPKTTPKAVATTASSASSKAAGDSKAQTPKTEYTNDPAKASPNWEEPADDGAAVDQAEIASAAQPVSTTKPASPTKPSKS